MTATLLRTRVDEGAARRELRRQIAHLEAQLQRRSPGIGSGGARLLGLAELADTRDALVAAVARGIAYHRALLEDALADPRRHKWLRIPRAAVGELGCGAYEVRPRVGLLGMLAGWWEVKLSSGCP
jgi:hypothetical protein